LKESLQVPVEIRTPAGADANVRAFVVGFASAVKPQMYRRLKIAERRYRQSVLRWESALGRIRNDPSNAVLRWKLSNDLGTFFHGLERELGLVVTNQRKALLRDLTLSKSDLAYTVRLAKRFDIDEIRNSGLPWSRFRELLDINEEDTMKRCMQLILAGKIRTTREIRSFHRKAKVP